MVALVVALLGIAVGEDAGVTPVSGAGEPLELASPPTAVKRVAPQFPDEALAAHVNTAECFARISIDAAGTPTDVTVSGCPDFFHEPVIDAVKRWRFKPATRDDQAVPSFFTLRIFFNRGDIDLGTFEAFKEVVAAYAHLDDAAALCVVTMTTHPDGSMSDLSSNRLPECLIVPSFVKRPGSVQKALDSDVACTARVSVKSGFATSVYVSGCDEPFAAHAQRSLKSFHYNYVDGKSEYEVRMTLAAQ